MAYFGVKQLYVKTIRIPHIHIQCAKLKQIKCATKNYNIKCNYYNTVYSTDDNLYWSDSRHDRIYVCDLDLNDCSIFLQEDGGDIKDIATDAEFIYFADYRLEYVDLYNLLFQKCATLFRSS